MTELDSENTFYPRIIFPVNGIEDGRVVIQEEGLQKLIKIYLQDDLGNSMRNWKRRGSISEKRIQDILYSYNPGEVRFSGFVDQVLYPAAEEILQKKGFRYNSENRRWFYSCK